MSEVERYKQLVEAAKRSFEKEDYEQAKKLLDLVKEEDHKYYDIYYVNGLISLQDPKKWEEAEGYFKKAEKLNSKDIRAHLRLMSLYTAKDLIQKADQECIILKKLVGEQKEPNKIFTYYRYKYDLEKKRKNWDKAEECCNEIIKMDIVPSSQKLIFKIKKVDVLLEKSKFVDCKKLIEEIKKEIKEGKGLLIDELYKVLLFKEFKFLKLSENFKEASNKSLSDEYKNAFKDDYYKLLLLKLMGHYYLRQYDKILEEEEDIKEKINKLSENGFKCLFYIACAKKNTGKIEDFKKYIKVIKEKSSIKDTEDFYLESAKYYFCLKDYEMSEQLTEKALRSNKKYIPALKFKIHLYNITDRQKMAEELLNKEKAVIEDYISLHDSIKIKAPTVESISMNFDNLGNEKLDISDTTEIEIEESRERKQSVRKVVKKIAEGGFGCVQVEEFDGVLYACKTLKNITKETKEEIKKEVCAMINLDHINIVKVEGYSSFEGKITMEYCDKGDLYDLIKNKYKELSVKDKIYLCLGVARGLEYIHSFDIIHCDMKTKNVLLKSGGKNSEKISDLIPKICDFGLSLVTQDESGKTDVTGLTLSYAAPEVLENKKIGSEGDIYSFGMIMLTVFTGKEPFDGMNMSTIQAKLKDYILPDPSYEIKDPAVSDNIKDLIAECLQKEGRPSAEQIVERLEEEYASYEED
ncbi:MAG: protein kinase [archaeon]|nr:protein kinase [archaeon]